MTQSRSIALQGVDELQLLNYSDKSLALKGTDLSMGINKDFLWDKFNLWGTFNFRLKDKNNNQKFGGWIFKKTDRDKVEKLLEFLKAGNKGDGKKRERSTTQKGREKFVKSPVSIDQHVVFLAWKKADDYDNQRKSFIKNPSFKTYIDDKGDLYIISKYTQIDQWTGSEGKEVTGTLVVSKGGKTERLYDNDKKPDQKKLTEIQIPSSIKVPREKRKPHYKLTNEVKEKINRKVLLKEIVFGKMEVGIKKVWNGYEDYYEYLSSEKMNWFDPMSDDKNNSFFSETIDTFFYNARHRAPYLSGEGIISLENYEIRYRSGGIKHKVKSRTSVLSKTAIEKVISALREKAEKLREKAEAKMSSGTWSQNWTNRRGRIMDGLEKDADRLKAKAEIFEALAKGWENDSLPEILKGIRNETEIDAIFRGNGNYYSYPKINSNTAEWAKKEIGAIKRRLEKIGITNEDGYNAAVEALKTIAHTEISTEEKQKRELRELENKWRNIKEKGFFPTPKTLARRLVEEAGIQPGEIVLEPSAGLGHIAEIIRELHPENELQVIERMVSLEQILLLKGFTLVGNDFLLYTPEAGKAPDKIIMNPPFENNQDITHLQHAYSILKPGGRVVAIIGEGAFFRQGKKETAFRDWLHQTDGVEEPLPENSFKGAEAFKQTGVRSRLVIIDKPGEQKEDDFSLALALQKQRIRILKLKGKAGLGNVASSENKKVQKRLRGSRSNSKQSKHLLNSETKLNKNNLTLTLQLQKQRIRLLALKKRNSKAQTKVQAVPLSKIHVNKKLFQNRETDYSHESVQRILEAVDNGTFRWEVFDPVLLWKSPSGKLYILSGHSRTQAFKELAKKHKKVAGKIFKSVPAKIIQVSEAEAKKIALESNTLSTKETDTERAHYYRGLRQQKKSKKEVADLAQKNEGKNWKKIFNLSYLNPKGFLIDSLKATENSDVQSKSVVNTIADWVGELRVRFPELTDSHEKEIADWLIGNAYGNKAGQISNKRMFLEKMENAIFKITEFGKIPPGKRLNLKKTVSKSPVEQDYERQVEALKREKKKALDTLKEKTEKLLKGSYEGKITKKKAQELLEPYQDNYMGLSNKLNKLLGKKYDITHAAKQQTSLFGLGRYLSSLN